MDELVDVSGVANEERSEREAQKQAAQAEQGRQDHQRPAQGLRPLTEDALDAAASSVRLATAAARHNWNKVLVRPK